MRIILACMFTLGVALLIGSTASAHVMITDETKSKGAILHIMPDDDPIAGEQATLYFDAQEGVLNDASRIDLTITREGAKESVRVPAPLDGSLVSSSYIFPTQGQYTIRYEIQTNGVTSQFVDTVRVARGATEPLTGNLDYPWASGLLIAISAFAAALTIIALNNRKAIREQSKF